ncbi:muscular LMNA-interacting protein isoform X2 [Narcine bancroftii]|uniref:muscular LMNA-interacting protein isoform X2 n=1 Tax=Narcine bancroftii TaxID=1343680 RepID=UPI00383126EF
MSFLSSSSFPSALHTKSQSSFNSSVKIPKTASLPSPLSPKHSLNCTDLHSSLLWSSSSLPSLRSTVNSSACVQSSPHSSSQNIQAPASQQTFCHCPRIHDFFCRPPVHKESAKSRDQSSSLSQLSLLTSILRSGQLTPVSHLSSKESKIVSSSTLTIGSQSYRKSPTQTSPASSSCQKVRPLSPTPGINFQRSSTMTGTASSDSPRALTSPLFPKPAALSGHSSPASLSKRQRTPTPPPLFSTKHRTHLCKLGNSTPMLSSLRHDTKPPISPHSASPRRLSPGPVYAPSNQQESNLSDKSLHALTSERSLVTLPISQSSSLVKCDDILLNTTSPSLSLSARPFIIFPRIEQSSSSSPTSTSPTPVNSSSSSTLVNFSLKSGSITPTPLNICSPSLSPMQNHSSSLKLGSYSTALTYSSSRKPPNPEKLFHQPSPFAKSNFTVNTAARSAALFPHSSADSPLAGPVKSPPPPSPTPRVGTHSPSLSLSRSTEIKQPEQKFKIKSSYKAFAAIPTNTLLWEQKAIDEAVSVSGDSVGQNTSEEAHSQFLFEPESLRQQSEELYAVIDQVLEDPLPMPIGRIPKSAGRETKYANLHLPSSESTEKRSTRPGVIRPVTVIQKLPATPKLEDNCPNPFRHHSDETNDTEIKEWHFPLSAILTSAPYPSVCNEMYQTTPRSQDIPQSVPLSLSPVTCLTSGSHIRFSPIVPYNYYMISNLSRSLHSLYIKPRHAITTIHENEALGITELVNATTKPIKDQFQKEGSEPGSGRSPMDVPDSGEEALMISQEDKEQGIK